MKKILIITSLIIFLNSCRWLSDAGRPFYSMTNFKVPPGTPSFQQGYKDGCETVSYARGNAFYKTRYKGYRYDPKMIGNSEYRFGHSRGVSFCFMQVISQPQSSFDNYLNYYDPTMMTQDYNTVGDGFLDGGVFSWSATNAGGGLNGIFDVYQKGGSGTTGGVFDSNPLWAGGSVGQFFGQSYSGSYYGN
jgi:hypothetical protein